MEGRVGSRASMTGVRGLPPAGMNRSEKLPLELDLVNTSERTCFHTHLPTLAWPLPTVAWLPPGLPFFVPLGLLLLLLTCATRSECRCH